MNPATAAPTQISVPGGASQFGDYSNWADQEIAKGFTPAQLQQSLSESGVQLPAAQPSAAPATAATEGHKPSWWQSLLPVAGGVVGGLAGTLLGPVGSIGGASIGGALGQALQNSLTGKKVIQGNIATSGIENGVGEVLGLGAGKIVGALGKGIAKAGGKAAAKMAEGGAADAATKGAIDDATATKLNFGGISDKLQSDLKLGQNQKFLGEMGLDATNPYHMQQAGQGVQELDKVYNTALLKAPAVKGGDVESILGIGSHQPTAAGQLTKGELSVLQRAGISPDIAAKGTVTGGNQIAGGGVGYEGIDAGSPLGKALKEFGLEPGQKIPGNLPATDLRRLQQSVGTQIGNTRRIINNAELQGFSNTEAELQLDDLKRMYGDLGTKLKTPEVDKIIGESALTPDERTALQSKYGEKYGNFLADTVDNSQKADDLLGPMQRQVQMNHASDMAVNDIENVTGTDRAVQRAKFKANGGVAPSQSAAGSGGGGAADMLINAASMTGHPVAKLAAVANRLHGAGLTPKIAEGVGNIMTRTAPLIPPAVVGASALPNIAASQESAIPLQQGTGEQGMMPAQQPGAMNPQNELFETLLRQAQLAPTVLGPDLAPVLAQLAPNIQKNQMAASAVAGLEPTMANAGGPQGLGGGLLARLTAMIPGTAANTYQGQQQAAATQLAAVLGITPQAAMAMLPQLMQTPQVAAPQQAGVQSLLGSLTAGLPSGMPAQ